MRKIWKSLLTLMLVTIFVGGLFGCGSQSNSNGDGGAQGSNNISGDNKTLGEQGVSGYETPWSNGIANEKLQSPFNLFNGGFAAAAGNWILFNNPDDNGYLYRMNKDGSEVTLLCAAQNVGSIWVSGQMVYFTSQEQYGINRQICSYDMRSKEQKQLLDETGAMLQYHDGYVYFLSDMLAGAGTLYRIPADGSRTPTGGYDKQEIYNSNPLKDFQISQKEGIIYAISGSYIWTLDMQGGSFKKAYEQELYRRVSWDSLEHIGVVSNSKTIQFFREYPEKFDWEEYFFAVQFNGNSPDVFNYFKGYAFYSDGRAVYLADTNTVRGIEADKGEKLLTASDVRYICIANGWAFCYQGSGIPTAMSMVQRPELA